MDREKRSLQRNNTVYLSTPETENEVTKGAFREYRNDEEEYNLQAEEYNSDSDDEFNDDSIKVKEDESHI